MIWPPQNTGFFELPPCIVCCGSPPDLYCRIRGDEAFLCGWSEYISPSTPPKKYRMQTANADVYFCNWGSVDCPATDSGTTHTHIDDAHGEYDIDTCVFTKDGVRHFGGAVIGPPCTPYGGALGSTQPANEEDRDMSLLPTFTGWTRGSTTPTYIEYTGDGTCANLDAFSSALYTGTRTWELSDEDTVEDAIARFQTDTVWGDWLQCDPVECCLAFWQEQPDDSFAFAYQEAQWRISKGGLMPSTLYNVSIDIFRRAYGTTDDWELYQTISDSGTTDAGGNLVVEGDVPNDEGFESYATNPVVAEP